jgi:SAM-dependent methyltransferase
LARHLSREVGSDLSMLERLVEPSGKDVVDVGCGGGGLIRDLVGLGARATGVEISDEQLASARSRDRGGGARYLVGCAEELPLGDGTVDVVVFMRSLHHVASVELPRALREACRVLRPGGVVYIAEPLAEGDFFALTSLVEDELEARRAAQAVIAEASQVGLDRVITVDYEVRLSIADLAALRARIVSVDPRRAAIFDGRAVELAEAFDRLGEAGERLGERWFAQPMRADVLRRGTPGENAGRGRYSGPGLRPM